MQKPKIYSGNAKYYDLIYGGKDYQKEVQILCQLISEYKRSDGKQLLDIACGTGSHLKYLSETFACEGIDINSELIEIAINKVPNSTFVKANMLNFNLRKKYDIITCLFSAIGYTKTLNNLKKALNSFYSHLKDGGVVLIEPWFTKNSKDFIVNVPFMTSHESDNVKISRISIANIENNLSTMDTHYIVGETGKGINHFSEKHTLGLFDKDEFLEIMTRVGFRAKFLEGGISGEGRGLYVGVKESNNS